MGSSEEKKQDHRERWEMLKGYIEIGYPLPPPAPGLGGRTSSNPFEGFDSELLQEVCESIRAKLQQLSDSIEQPLNVKVERSQLSMHLGRVLLSLGQLNEADQVFESMLRNNPDSKDAVRESYRSTADTLRRQKKYEEAHLYLQKALAVDSSETNKVNMGLRLADNWIALGKEKEAEQAFRELIESFPKDLGLSYRVADVYKDHALDFKRGGNLEKACSFLETALQFSQQEPQSARLLFYWGEILFQLERWKEAKEKFLSAVELKPEKKREADNYLKKIEKREALARKFNFFGILKRLMKRR